MSIKLIRVEEGRAVIYSARHYHISSAACDCGAVGGSNAGSVLASVTAVCHYWIHGWSRRMPSGGQGRNPPASHCVDWPGAACKRRASIPLTCDTANCAS